MSAIASAPTGPFRFRRSLITAVVVGMVLAMSGWGPGFPAGRADLVVSWSPTTAAGPFGGELPGVEIAVSDDGTVGAAAWSQLVAGEMVTQFATATIAGSVASWGPVQTISSPGSSSHLLPRLAMSSDGARVTVAWFEFADLSTFLRVRSATVAGSTATWGPIQTFTDGDRDPSSVSLALSSDGRKAALAWTSRNMQDYTDQRLWLNSGVITDRVGSWDAGTAVTDGLLYSVPAVEMSADGTAVTLAWGWATENASRVQSVSGTVSPSGVALGPVTNVSAPDLAGLDLVLALSASGGTALLSWTSHPDSNSERARYAAATIAGTQAQWSTEADLAPPGVDSWLPAVALSADGSRAAAAWAQESRQMALPQSKTGTLNGNQVTWGDATTMSDGPQEGISELTVGMSADGARATVLWNDSFRVLAPESATVGTAAHPGPPAIPSHDTGLLRARVGEVSGTSTLWQPAAILADGFIASSGLDVAGQGSTVLTGWAYTVDLGTEPDITWSGQPQLAVASVRFPAPTLAAVSPKTGSVAGGTQVTLTGTGFREGTTITVGGAPCQSVKVVSATTLQCVTPAGSVGAADVTVTNTDGQSSTLAGGFTYEPQPLPPTPPKTLLRVTGRAHNKAVPVDHTTVLVRSVHSNGPVLVRRAWCDLKGSRLSRRVAGRLCGLTVKGPKARTSATAIRDRHISVVAHPRCTRGLRLHVRFVARAASAPRATWQRTWRMSHAHPTVCRVRATG